MQVQAPEETFYVFLYFAEIKMSMHQIFAKLNQITWRKNVKVPAPDVYVWEKKYRGKCRECQIMMMSHLGIIAL